MPLRSGRGKKSRANVHEAESTLSGWEFIQETLLSHDEDMVADFADDIDTLLVFAGLFSAVLTAFLVVSMVLLQPDNSQLSVQLLALIALQNGVSSNLQPFLNATASSLPDSTTFHQPTNVVAINALWLVSLVLSLVTALLGILAKQWCREYLRWHSVIATARENVLVRQLRFDAWEKWRVPTLIALTPAFLEIALVLFLVGLLVFVPTFANSSLTIVVSVVAASALLGAAAMTLLPVFFRSCPFQSPTGWALVYFASLMRTAYWQIARIASIALSKLFKCLFPGRHVRLYWLTDLWLHSSLTLSDAQKLRDWRTYTLNQVVDPLLFNVAFRGIRTIYRWTNVICDKAYSDVRQTRVLVDALLWVRRGSDGGRVFDKILDCLQSIHTASASAEPIDRKPHSLSAMHAICTADLLPTRVFVQSFYQAEKGAVFFRTGFPIGLRSREGPYLNIAPYEGFVRQHWETCVSRWESNPVSLIICHALVRFDILSLVDDWLSVITNAPLRKRVAQRIVFDLCLLRIIPSDIVAHGVHAVGKDLAKLWAVMLQEVYHRLAPHKQAYSDGLVSMCVELCRFLGPVVFQHQQGEPHVVVRIEPFDNSIWFHSYGNRDCNCVSTWANLAVDIYDASGCYEDDKGRHLFVTSINFVLETMRLRIAAHEAVMNYSLEESVEPLAKVLSLMIHAIRWSLLHSAPDCGAYTPIAWIRGMRQCYETGDHPSACQEQIPFTGDSSLRPTFLLMLSLLKVCLSRGLLTGEGIATDFQCLLTLVGRPDLPDAGFEPGSSFPPLSTEEIPDAEEVIPSSSRRRLKIIVA